MIQWKISDIFKDLPNVFDIADNIFAVGYDANGRDHNKTLKWVMQIFQWENLKLNKNKCLFRCTKILFFREIITRDGLQPDARELHMLTEMPPSII